MTDMPEIEQQNIEHDDHGDPRMALRPAREPRLNVEMDMTPMVDVVFLLIIFFMVSASFGLQKSIEAPASEQQQGQSASPSESQDKQDEIIVLVTKENKIFVEGDEAPSQQELHSLLRKLKSNDSSLTTQMVRITADMKTTHELVIRVIDAVAVVGLDGVRLETLPDTN